MTASPAQFLPIPRPRKPVRVQPSNQPELDGDWFWCCTFCIAVHEGYGWSDSATEANDAAREHVAGCSDAKAQLAAMAGLVSS